jgi:hypothetical protein
MRYVVCISKSYDCLYTGKLSYVTMNISLRIKMFHFMRTKSPEARRNLTKILQRSKSIPNTIITLFPQLLTNTITLMMLTHSQIRIHNRENLISIFSLIKILNFLIPFSYGSPTKIATIRFNTSSQKSHSILHRLQKNLFRMKR